jgi:hypothetical protein
MAKATTTPRMVARWERPKRRNWGKRDIPLSVPAPDGGLPLRGGGAGEIKRDEASTRKLTVDLFLQTLAAKMQPMTFG